MMVNWMETEGSNSRNSVYRRVGMEVLSGVSARTFIVQDHKVSLSKD